MPLPQLATTGRFPWMIWSASAAPTALSRAALISEGERNVEYSCPVLVLCFCKKRLNVKEYEWGIWPEERPGRGSGSVPVYLDQIDLSIEMTVTKLQTSP